MRVANGTVLYLSILMLVGIAHAQIPTNGLVAYYPFNGNANDSSGNGRNGTVHGVTLTTDRFESTNAAYRFDIGTSISVPQDPVFNVSGDITLSAWYKMQPGAIVNNMTIADKRINNSSFWGLYVERSSIGGVTKPRMLFALLNNTFGSYDYHYSTDSIVADSWSHVVIVVRHDTSCIYLDGILDSVSPITISRPTNTQAFEIGSPGGLERGETFVGSMDDIRIYNRALSEVEIESLYHEGGWDGGLPVQLTNFTCAVSIEGTVRLDWTTISEVKSYGFYVESRRFNEVAFSETANSFTAAHGTTITPHYYSFICGNPNGARYYRLKQVDLDGAIHYSEPIDVNVAPDLNGIETAPFKFVLEQNYPNPFNPLTTIRYGIPQQSRVTLTLFNTLGQLVATLVNENQNAGYHVAKFDGTGLASGVYLYRFQAGEFVQMRKLLLLK